MISSQGMAPGGDGCSPAFSTSPLPPTAPYRVPRHWLQLCLDRITPAECKDRAFTRLFLSSLPATHATHATQPHCSPSCTDLGGTTVLPPPCQPALSGLARLRGLLLKGTKSVQTGHGSGRTNGRMKFCPLWLSKVGPTPNPSSSRAVPKLPRTQQESPFCNGLGEGSSRGLLTKISEIHVQNQRQDWIKKEEC